MAGKQNMVLRRIQRLIALQALLLTVAACGTGGLSRPHGQTSPPGSGLVPSSSARPPAGSGPAGFEPAAASFLSGRQGWVLGRGGCASCAALRLTSDGGVRWTALPVPPASLGYYAAKKTAVTDIVFANASDGFLFGPGLLATRDGGRSWTREVLPPVLALRVGAGYAIALTQAGSDGPVGLWRSAIGSRHWAPLPLPARAAALSALHDGARLSVQGRTVLLLQRGNTSVAVTTGEFGRLWASYDSGTRWQARPVPCQHGDGGAALVAVALGQPRAWLMDCFDNEQSSQEQDTQHHLYGTADAGRSWRSMPDPARHNLPVLIADNGAGHAFLATEGGADNMAGTTDGGRHWRILLTTGGSFFGWADLGFVSAATGFVVGPTHYAPEHLYRTDDGGRTWHVVHI